MIRPVIIMGFLLTSLTLGHIFFSSLLRLSPSSLLSSILHSHWSSFVHSVFNSKVYTKDYTLTPYYLVTAAYALEQCQRITNSTDLSEQLRVQLWSLSSRCDALWADVGLLFLCYGFLFVLWQSTNRSIWLCIEIYEHLIGLCIKWFVDFFVLYFFSF